MKQKHMQLYRLIALAALVSVILTLSAVFPAAAADAGSLDTSFDGDGIVTIDFGNVGDFAQDVVLDADGKIIVAGYSFNGVNDDFALVRLNTDGSLDTTFDGDGKVITDFGGNDQAYGVALDSLGRIILAGYSDVDANEDVAIAVYTPNGVLDVSFAGDGLLNYDSLGLNKNDYARDVDVDSADKIVIAGYALEDFGGSLVARFNADGTLDASFGVRYETVIYDFLQAVQVDAAQRVLAVGEDDVSRHTSNGTLDTTFGGDGRVTLSCCIDAYDMVSLASGKILFSGGTGTYITRINSDGSADTSFSSDGELAFSLTGDDYALAVAVDSQARIVTAGYYTPTTNNTEFAITRVDNGGNVDVNFGNNGVVTTAFGSGQDRGRGLAIDANDNIVVVGYRTGAAANVDFTVLRYLGEDTVPTNTPTHTPTDTLPPTQTFTPSPTITPGGPTLTPTQTPTTEPTATATPDPSLTELLTNNSFETDSDGNKIPDGWTGSNTALANTDKVKCNKDTNDDGIPDKIFARTGSCAFEFKGNVT
ncbi:MAG: hypothetical protein H7Y11_16025, partial [Armatimonadetes bacterium]|nr:hypothetical protein [Anaerolineae bacterium]